MKNKWKQMGILLLVTVLFEILVCNFSSIKTMGNAEKIIAEQMKTDQKGNCEVSMALDSNNMIKVNNIEIHLQTERYDRAKVTVSLTDEGNRYPYALPSFEVVPEVAESGYKNLYPYGKVSSVNVKIEVPEGTEATVEKIAVNVRRPFRIRPFRMTVVFVILFLLYGIWKQKEWTLYPCKRKCRWQLVTVAGMILLLSVSGLILARSNPACLRNLWPHHGQYQELAHVLAKGEVALEELPEEQLIEAENPYDTAALRAENIYYKMDYAFYNGRYYAYFGIVPELLFYLPYFLLSGKDFPNFLAVALFYSGFVLGVFGLVWELVHRYWKKMPFLGYLLSCTTMVLAVNYTVLVARPDIYNVAVMGGSCFLVLGCFLLVKGLQEEDRKWLWYLLGAFSFSLVAGCRPQMLLYSLFLLPPFLKEIKERRLFSKTAVKESFSLAVPILIVGAVVCWYNIVRFGSPVDFGATYSLTTNDMNHRGFNLSRIMRGLFNFYLQPPVLLDSFPFLSSVLQESSYMGKSITEFFYGGVLFICPFTLAILYFFFEKKEKKWQEWEKLAAVLTVISLGTAMFDINGAGVIIRYQTDAALGILLAAALIWAELLTVRKNDGNIYRVFYCTCIISMLFGFLAVISEEGTVNLHQYHPELYYKIASYFSF